MRRIGAIVSALLMSPGVIVAVSSPASANDIRVFTTYQDCTPTNSTEVTGTVRIYTRWLRDLTPNPDKLRPLAFTIQNRLNHTMAVTSVRHDPTSQDPANSWMEAIAGGQVVLTLPNAAGQHQFGTIWAANDGQYPGGPSLNQEINDPRSMPYSTSDTTTSRSLWRNNQTDFNHESPAVALWKNNSLPWWTELSPYGPYFFFTYNTQGDYSSCAGWYPPN